MKKPFLALLLATASLFAFASFASAGPILSAQINGVLFCATDNNTACVGNQLPDLDPTAGSLNLGSVNVGGVIVNSSTHTQDIAAAPGDLNILNSQSLQIINNTGGTVTATASIGGIDFNGPVSFVESSGSGTWQTAAGSTIQMNWCADAANGPGGITPTSCPGVTLATFSDTAGGGVDAFSTAGSILTAFAATGPFSMTTQFTMSLVAGGQLNSRGQVMIAELTPVPEPATMMLLGTGLLAAFRARKKLGR